MLGIAVISYNRIASVTQVLENIMRHTTAPFELVVADDGSPDGSRKTIEAMGQKVVSGKNMGVCWNKNRALFFLKCIRKCTIIILIEDDSWPVVSGWEADWIKAIEFYDHVNLAGIWFSENFISGSGTPQDPIFSRAVSGQCTGYSAEALSYVGYLDTRFQGYGVGHVEHSKRFLKAGYGGLFACTASGLAPHFILLKSEIVVTNPKSSRNKQQLEQNERLSETLKEEPIFRTPWRTDREMAQFRSEMRDAQSSDMRKCFDEEFYINNHSDVASAISRGEFKSGEQHYLFHGQYEFRFARRKD